MFPFAFIRPTKQPLLISLCALPMLSFAHTVDLNTVVVSSAGQNSVYDVAQPVNVLGKDAIDANPGTTLGTLLNNTPGIANAAFGAGVGRPVIRGMSGSRVKILLNGSDSADVSAMSSDHAPMVEASSAEQVEVIYGPATLMYGGSAIGGVVNVIDRRIHEVPDDGIRGEVVVKGSSNDKGYSTNALLDMGHGNWTLHLDGFKRDAADYASGERGRVPAKANRGRIANSDSNAQGGAIALSWADGINGFVGGSISTLDYDYGVPNLNNDGYRVIPKQVRYDLKGAWRPNPSGVWGWLEEWRTELSFNDYQHAETEPGKDVGFFDQESWELRSVLRHQPMARWNGTLGIQAKHNTLGLCHSHDGCDGVPNYDNTHWDGSEGTNISYPINTGYAFSHDTPMPLTETQQLGLFVVQQRDWQYGTFELGARFDQVTIQADPTPIRISYRQQRDYYDDVTFTPMTFSAAGTWILSEQQRLGLSLGRVQRAPEATELFWNGDHHATFSFQLDNPDLDLETAYTLDVNWLHQGQQDQLRVALFYYRFQDYIYNDMKGFTDPFGHGSDVYRHEQTDARFRGAEFSWQHDVSDRWHLDVIADVVQAEKNNGDNLPRTPPASVLLALNYEWNRWDARIESKWVDAQNATAENEQASPGHTVFNARVAYQKTFTHSELMLALALENMTDEYAINHVSYLKYAAPMPGRNVLLSTRWRF